MSDAAIKARREAYDRALESCGMLHQQILLLLKNHPDGLTRAEIAQLGCIKLQTVCGRVAELKDLKLVKELPERRKINGSSSSVLVRCDPPSHQPSLFDDQVEQSGDYYRGGL